VDPTSAPKIQKPKSRIRKLGRIDIEWSNPYGDQATHYIACIESLNANNSCYNRKNARTTSDVEPTICVSSAKKKKTQVRWAIVVRRKVRK
jgi:hypothetical protein